MAAAERAGPAVIVDPFSSGGMYAPAFAEHAIPAVAVMSRRTVLKAYRSSFHPEDFHEIIAADGDEAGMARRVRELAPRCILPGAESGVELADRLAALILPDLANTPETAAARRHKYAMARAAERAGLAVPRQICTDSPDAVAAWLERERLTGADLVIKPPKSASTDGVTRVRGGRGWRAVFDGQLGQLNRWDIRNDEMIVQEYLSGTEYVVDIFSYEGIHTVTDVCRYHKVDNGPHMAVYENMEWLGEADPVVDELVSYTRRFLDAAGFRFGAAHVEIMYTADGPRLIELNSRPHGGGQPKFCRAATGDSQVDRAARYFAGQRPVPLGFTLLRHTLVVFLIGRQAGIVRNAEVFDRVKNLASYFSAVIGIGNGDRLALTKDLLNTLELGFVVLAHADRDQVLDDYAAVRRIEGALVVEPAGEIAESSAAGPRRE